MAGLRIQVVDIGTREMTSQITIETNRKQKHYARHGGGRRCQLNSAAP